MPWRSRQAVLIGTFGLLGIASYFLPWIDESKRLIMLGFSVQAGKPKSQTALSLSMGSGGHIYLAYLVIMILCAVAGLVCWQTNTNAGRLLLKVLGVFGLLDAIWSTWDLSRSVDGTRELIFIHFLSTLDIGFWLAVTAAFAIVVIALIPADPEDDD
ncbi:MAG: hypothetical protein ACRDP7_41835 [Trebonia sp.]